MPLSEDEQRILGEIEANLRASDPDLAKQVGSTTVYTDSLRKLKWGVVGFVVALVGSILLLSVSYLLAFGGQQSAHALVVGHLRERAGVWPAASTAAGSAVMS